MLSYRSNDVASKLTNDVVSCGHKHKKKDTIFIVSFFLEAPPRIELGIRVLQTRALPLGHGAVLSLKRGTLKKRLSVPFWSGLRGSNSLPPPWQGGALPDELNPQINGASDRNRTNDTGIFSPLLYLLSYRGKSGDLDGVRTHDL